MCDLQQYQHHTGASFMKIIFLMIHLKNNLHKFVTYSLNIEHRVVLLGDVLDFRKVLRTISSGSKLARAFGARFIRLIYGFLPFSIFLSCLYIVPLPKILASRLVASLVIYQFKS